MKGEGAQALLAGFEGVALDAEAQAAIMAALHDCAARTRALEAGKEAGGDEGADWQADDPEEPFVPMPERGLPWRGTLEPAAAIEMVELPEGEDSWVLLGEEKPKWLVEMEDGGAGSRDRDVDGSAPE